MDSSSVHHQESFTVCTAIHKGFLTACSQAVSKHVWHIPLLCVQWKTPYDGQKNCPKHVEFYSINKLEKLVHLKKVKWSRNRPGVVQRVDRGTALLFHDRGTRRGEWSAARLGCTLPPGKTQYPFYRMLGGPQGQSRWVENLVPTMIWSQTIQPVVSCCTDWATQPIISASSWFYYKNLSRCTVTWTSDSYLVCNYLYVLQSSMLWSVHLCLLNIFCIQFGKNKIAR